MSFTNRHGIDIPALKIPKAAIKATRPVEYPKYLSM